MPASTTREDSVEAAGSWWVGTVSTTPSPTFEVDVLGGVREQRQPVERPQDENLFVERVLRKGGANVLDAAATGPAGVHRDLADSLDEFIDGPSVRLLDRVAQQATEQADVVTDGVAAVG